MSRRSLISLLFAALVAFAPSGTRYIFKMGMIDGNPIEPGTWSIYVMQIVAVAFAVMVFVTAGRTALSKLLQRPQSLFAISLAFFAVMSAAVSDDPRSSLFAAANVVIGVAVFLAIIAFQPEPHEVLASFVGGALFQFIIGAYQFITQSDFASKWLGMAMHTPDQLGAFVIETDNGRWLRAYGSLPHPNVYGLYVGIGLLMCIGLAAFLGVPRVSEHKSAFALFLEKGHFRHMRFYAFMPILTAGLFFSFSRSAILAVAAGFVWMVVSAYGSKAAESFRTVLVPSFIIISITAFGFAYVYSDLVTTRATVQGSLEQQSIQQRAADFSDGIAIAFRNPFTGVGPGEMVYAVQSQVSAGRQWYQYQEAHNVPLLIFAETGLGGLASWLGFVIYTFVLMANYRKYKAGPSSGVTVYASCFIALIVAAQFDHFQWSLWFGQLLFWVIAGLLHDAYIRYREMVPA